MLTGEQCGSPPAAIPRRATRRVATRQMPHACPPQRSAAYFAELIHNTLLSGMRMIGLPLVPSGESSVIQPAFTETTLPTHEPLPFVVPMETTWPWST